MAIIPVTATRDGNWLKFSWEAVLDADTCAPIYVNHNVSDMVIQVTGTFGTATITMTGGVTSSLGVTGLLNPSGDAIGIAVAGGDAIRDLWPFMAPATAGGSSSDLDIEVRMKIVK
jgi:hypothetical protein